MTTRGDSVTFGQKRSLRNAAASPSVKNSAAKRAAIYERAENSEEKERLANLMRLINHPYRDSLRLSERGMLQYRCDRSGRWKALGGIVDAIQQTFYPQYDYRRASNAAKRLQWRPQKEPAAPNPLFVGFRSRLDLAGRSLGEFIDEEFSRVVEYLVPRSLPMTPDTFEHLKISPYTRALLQFHHDNRWQPLFSQYKVMAPGLGVGTRIDEICMTEDGRLIVVELKYGYDQYREFGNATMNSPLDDCLDSPQHQHMLQCGIPALMLQRYWGIRIDGAFVIYITDGEVYPLPVAAWFWERQNAIWDAFEHQMRKRV